MNRIYLDYAATTPVRAEVLEAMLPCFREGFGNPGSQHAAGQAARSAVERARQQVADALGALPQEIVFTSGGTESNNWVLRSVAREAPAGKKRFAVSALEHHAVLNVCEALEKEGIQTALLSPDGDGILRTETLSSAMNGQESLVSVMTANNEIGTLQPIPELAAIAHEHGALFHTDAVQAVGHCPMDVHGWQVDFLSLSGHKLGAPKGIGALYIRKGTRLPGLMLGGSQEQNRRAGTENVPGIVGLGAAIALATREMARESARLTALRDELIRGVLATIPASRLNGHPTRRLPGNAHFSFQGIRSDALVTRLDLCGIEASAGAACTAGVLTPSHVLRAIHPEEKEPWANLRLTLGPDTTGEEIQRVLRVLPGVVEDLRRLSGWEVEK